MIAQLEFFPPDFNEEKYLKAPDVILKEVKKDGIAPNNFFLTSHAPTYYKYNGKWHIPTLSSLNCLSVYENEKFVIKEISQIKIGEKVVCGHSEDASQGILKYDQGFSKSVIQRERRSVESSSIENYELLFQLMEDAKENGGYIVWVLGPAVVFDHDTRNGLSSLAKAGYVHSLLGGNAMATHDLEGGYLNTALGQDIYTQESRPQGHYNHLDLLNEVRRAGSIDNFIKNGKVKDGFIKSLKEMNIPITLAGSIRDDGPLPEVIADMDQALYETKKECNKATLIISLATMLHSVSTAELASSYRIDQDGTIKPIFIYTIDVTENAVNKVAAAREGIAVHRLVTNVQDFVVNLERRLVKKKEENK